MIKRKSGHARNAAGSFLFMTIFAAFAGKDIRYKNSRAAGFVQLSGKYVGANPPAYISEKQLLKNYLPVKSLYPSLFGSLWGKPCRFYLKNIEFVALK